MARAHQSRSNIYRPDFYDDAMIFLIYFAPTATVFESPEPRVLKGVYYNVLLFDLLHAGVAVFRYPT